MSKPNDTLLLKAWRRASRRRRWYALFVALALVAVSATVAGLRHGGGRAERPSSQQAHALVAMQHALAQQNRASQVRIANQALNSARNQAIQARLEFRAAKRARNSSSR